MSQDKIAFQYGVLRYTHDPVRQEVLNVGILVYCREMPAIGLKINVEDPRLDIFSNFDMKKYRPLADGLRERVMAIDCRLDKIAAENGYRPRAIQTVAEWMVPLSDLVFGFDLWGMGITEGDLFAEMEKLYQRLVA